MSTATKMCNCLMLALALLAPLVTAESRSPATLISEGSLQVATTISPSAAVVPGQKLKLQLEIATARWFGGGTRIALPEVPGLVILQSESFASNSSEQRMGATWVVQRWTLDVYPQRAGQFTIPPLTATLTVNDETAGDVKGDIEAPGISFTAAIPKALAQADLWVASPSFKVSQSVDRNLDTMSPGDAFEREIRFEASDVMAMMLPGFSPADTPGLAAYPLPPELENRSNRGESSALRVEKISYVAQRAGSYTLPSQEYLWWDSVNASLQLLVLPALEITVSGTGTGSTDSNPHYSKQQLAWAAVATLLFLCLAWLARGLLAQMPWQLVLAPVRRSWQVLLSLRQPALPESLNPGPTSLDP
ncbi:MAG: BatD family protein [Halioglobus sp.]